MKRFVSTLLVLCMLCLTGCVSEPPKTPVQFQNQPTQVSHLEMKLGYVPEEVSSPEWLDSVWGWDTYGDTVWLGGRSVDGSFLFASYDTILDKWDRYDLDTEEAHNPVAKSFSVSKDAVWILFEELYTESDINGGANLGDLGYYLFYRNLTDGSGNCSRLSSLGDFNTGNSNTTISSIQAIDASRALLTTDEGAYLINPKASTIKKTDLPLWGLLVHMRVNNQLFLYLWDDDCFAFFDIDALQFGKTLPMTGANCFSSNAGNYYCLEDRTLFRYDLSSQSTTEIFNWMNVALSYKTMGSSTVFENSAGEFFYPTENGIIKVTNQLRPEKSALTLGCFGDTEDAIYEYRPTSYYCSAELMDAIIRFNNTDPEYVIKIMPMIYSSSAERDRLLIELATNNNIDLLDTSLLPENAIKEGFLVNLLPYIDSDEEINRTDFIEPLFSAMIKNNALCEYTNKFTLLTITTHPSLFNDRNTWTVENLLSIAKQHPELSCLSRQRVLQGFIWAATAEFVDWQSMTCSFESAEFRNWLKFLSKLPETAQSAEKFPLFELSTDFASDAGFWTRLSLNDDYVISGFPDVDGTGSYFVKLDNPIATQRSSIGSSTRLGIMASSPHTDGAWRFLKALMLSESGDNITTGIPVLRGAFEKALITSINANSSARSDIASFNELDAQILRDQVYNTTKLVHNDDMLLDIIRSELNAYFSGQKSEQETSQLIQSKVSLYLSEQG